jgi:hypothetical protein
MYENKKVYIPKLDEEVHISRIIASWRNRNGNMFGFKSWLKELGLDDYDITRVWYLATNGKLELQNLADEFCKVHPKYRNN